MSKVDGGALDMADAIQWEWWGVGWPVADVGVKENAGPAEQADGYATEVGCGTSRRNVR